MTVLGGVGENKQRQQQRRNAAILRCAQNDDVKLTTRTRVKTKYRDLSTAAAKCAAFGRDDVCYELGLKRTSKASFRQLLRLVPACDDEGCYVERAPAAELEPQLVLSRLPQRDVQHGVGSNESSVGIGWGLRMPAVSIHVAHGVSRHGMCVDVALIGGLDQDSVSGNS